MHTDIPQGQIDLYLDSTRNSTCIPVHRLPSRTVNVPGCTVRARLRVRLLPVLDNASASALTGKAYTKPFRIHRD
jgi:hypothetical protein